MDKNKMFTKGVEFLKEVNQYIGETDNVLIAKNREISELKAKINALELAYADLKSFVGEKEQPTVDSLCVGETLFIVMALGAQSYYTRRTVTSSPYVGRYTNKLFINTSYINNGVTIYSHESLDDINIVPNTYNNHKAFYHEVTAYDYLRKCIAENITLKSVYSMFIPTC